jgi:ribonuclease HI
MLRGQKVYARANESGVLVADEDGGRVEIRYKPNDGRRYGARVDNLVVVDAAPLPDATCGPAEAPPKADPKATGGPAAAPGPSKRANTTAKLPEGTVIAYADGACSGNPGPAGLGAVIIDGKSRTELSEYLGVQTNNIAELTAVLRVLGEVPPASPLVIHTDSQYTIGILQKGWKAKANVELIAQLRAVLATHDNTRLAYVPGHSGVLLNERADALAREAVAGRCSRREVYSSEPKP